MLNISMEINTQIDFAITTYCQAKCRSCQRTNEDTGEVNSWLTPTHMSYTVFDNIVNNIVALFIVHFNEVFYVIF